MQLRIKRSISTIKNVDLQQHSRRTEQIKSRITKFKRDVSSSRVLLKCEASLLSIDRNKTKEAKEGMRRFERNRSLNSKFKPGHIITNPFDEKSVAEQSISSELNRLDGFEKIFLKRNQEKIKGYFQQSTNLTPINKRSRPGTMQQIKKSLKTEPSHPQTQPKHGFTADVEEKIKKVQ